MIVEIQAAAASPTRRISVINSNSSDVVTEQLARTAAPHLLPGTHAEFSNPVLGPAGIDTLAHLAEAAVHTADMVRARGDAFDAYVVACGNDPGLAAAREATSRPVVGIAEAGFLQACGLGASFSVAVLAPGKERGMRSLVRSYGLETRLSGVIAAQSSSLAATAEPDELLEQLTRACQAAPRALLGDSLVLTGSVMGRIAPQLSDRLGLPVISGLLAGIRLAETLAESAGVSRLPSPASSVKGTS